MKIVFLLLSVIISFSSFGERKIFTEKQMNLVKTEVTAAYQQYPEIVMMIADYKNKSSDLGTGFFCWL